MVNLSKSPSRHLAQIACDIRFEDLSAATLEYTKSRLLDFFASAVAGYRVNYPMSRVMLETVRGLDRLKQSGVLFSGEMLSAPAAAFMNAFYGHGADIDDGHRIASGHPGTCTVPAVFSLGQARKSAPRDIIAATVAGYEVFVRLACAVMPSHVQRGFHSSGTCGTVACAAAAGRLIGLDAERMHRALSLGAVTASGLFEVSETAQAVKPINPANAARAGIFAALLAEAGMEAPEAPFDGVKGFFSAYTDKLEAEYITAPYQKGVFKIDECYTKMYPACRHLHGLTDCAVMFHGDGVQPDEIAEIVLHSYPNSIAVTGNILEPEDEGGAKFSMTYAVARALLSGGFTLDDLSGAKNMSGETRELIRKMRIVSDPGLEIREKRIRGAKVELVMKGGAKLAHAVDFPKGEPESRTNGEDILRKLRLCAGSMYDGARTQLMHDVCMDFENRADASELLGLFTV